MRCAVRAVCCAATPATLRGKRIRLQYSLQQEVISTGNQKNVYLNPYFLSQQQQQGGGAGGAGNSSPSASDLAPRTLDSPSTSSVPIVIALTPSSAALASPLNQSNERDGRDGRGDRDRERERDRDRDRELGLSISLAVGGPKSPISPSPAAGSNNASPFSSGFLAAAASNAASSGAREQTQRDQREPREPSAQQFSKAPGSSLHVSASSPSLLHFGNHGGGHDHHSAHLHARTGSSNSLTGLPLGPFGGLAVPHSQPLQPSALLNASAGADAVAAHPSQSGSQSLNSSTSSSSSSRSQHRYAQPHASHAWQTSLSRSQSNHGGSGNGSGNNSLVGADAGGPNSLNAALSGMNALGVDASSGDDRDGESELALSMDRMNLMGMSLPGGLGGLGLGVNADTLAMSLLPDSSSSHLLSSHSGHHGHGHGHGHGSHHNAHAMMQSSMSTPSLQSLGHHGSGGGGHLLHGGHNNLHAHTSSHSADRHSAHSSHLQQAASSGGSSSASHQLSSRAQQHARSILSALSHGGNGLAGSGTNGFGKH